MRTWHGMVARVLNRRRRQFPLSHAPWRKGAEIFDMRSKAILDGFRYVALKLVESLSLGGAARQLWNFRPESAFFRIVDQNRECRAQT